MELRARNHRLQFPCRPLVMGILNLGADSFCGDGIIDRRRAIDRARELVAQGADILDLGAESARTNRAAISEQEEIDCLAGFLQTWRAEVAEMEKPVLLSINTWRPAVAKSVLSEGGDILNDIGGLPTDANARICAQTGAALLLMHSVGEPKVPHTHVHYTDVLGEMEQFFTNKIQLALSAGLALEQLILDPGIDFAKQRRDNLLVYQQLGRLEKFGRPILLPVSRKTVIGEVLGIGQPVDRDAGTVACMVSGILRGASIFRVHNVPAAVSAVRMVGEILGVTKA